MVNTKKLYKDSHNNSKEKKKLDTVWQHPGFSRRKVRHAPRGRQVTSLALETLDSILNSSLLERTLLIEYLHLIQDRCGFLPSYLLVALADRLSCSLTEVYEVSSFYAHFNIVEDDVKEGSLIESRAFYKTAFPLTLRICDGISCMLAGAEELLTKLESRYSSLPTDLRIRRAPCMGRCDRAPVAALGKRLFDDVSVEEIIDNILKVPIATGTTSSFPPLCSFKQAKESGRYCLLQRCLDGEWTRKQVIDIFSQAGLCGLGGAGFPSFRKWSMVLSCSKPRFMVVNADEGEPGTFKDRWYLMRDLHRVLEGMLIAAWLVEADKIWFYLRDEYPDIYALLQRELPIVDSAGFLFSPKIFLRRGAGAYICGEESAMLESIEGKRGLPRHKPPYPAEVGLFGRPTLIHNVETLYWIPEILKNGANWYSSQGLGKHKGFRSYSVSGRVRLPGVKVAPAGITLRALLEEHCGGMADGHTFLGYLPGGASGGILNAQQIDIPLDFGTLTDEGCFVGSYAVVVFSDHDDPATLVRNLLRFFEEESCGQCTPCRVGTEKVVALLNSPSWDRALLEELCSTMADASICGLGQAAGNPIRCLLKNFPDYIPSS